ncbi:MAG: hypothetical protein II723_04175 [Oscillospiraceae bacterium]|nr:hypothetical protein [Oscillospiraceae bacterium]
MKLFSYLSASAALAVLLAAVPMPASAAGDTVYGTMNIPYTDFYAAELGSSAGTVDAVTSATKTKALKNGAGELFEGSYNNGTDTILGVTYPVAVSRADLDALGSDNFGFQELDSTPEAYKNVTVSGGKASFSAVQDASPETASVGVRLSTETPWGDYLIDLTEQPEGFDTKYRGALLKTSDGKAYAMRHEQNIWRGELAWSSGIKTEEPHGNKLDYAAYTGLMGSTVTEIVLITEKGYVTVSTNTYIPVKFEGSLTVENGDAGTGSTGYTAEGVPTDYEMQFAVGEGFTVEGGKINYQNAKPGSYTMTMQDGSGKYAPMSASFTLETDDLPVQFKDGSITAAEGFTAEDAAAFLKNLSSVTVGETEYRASGRGAVKVIAEDGSVNFDAESREGKVFADGADSKDTLTVKATGFRKALTFTLNAPAEETTAPADETTASESTQTQVSGSDSANNGGSNVTAPKAGETGTGTICALLALAGITALVMRKKRVH